jgi:hypothetical protein
MRINTSDLMSMTCLSFEEDEDKLIPIYLLLLLLFIDEHTNNTTKDTLTFPFFQLFN